MLTEKKSGPLTESATFPWDQVGSWTKTGEERGNVGREKFAHVIEHTYCNLDMMWRGNWRVKIFLKNA